MIHITAAVLETAKEMQAKDLDYSEVESLLLYNHFENGVWIVENAGCNMDMAVKLQRVL